MDDQIKGRVWGFGDDINTDLMYPHICYSLPERDRPKYTMWANRPGWASHVNKGDIIVAGRNFGVGSSRPAAANLVGLGIVLVMAESVNGLFMRNAVNSGLPVLRLDGVTQWIAEGDVIRVDFQNCTVTREQDGSVREFTRIPDLLMGILRSGGIIEVLRSNGYIDKEPL